MQALKIKGSLPQDAVPVTRQHTENVLPEKWLENAGRIASGKTAVSASRLIRSIPGAGQPRWIAPLGIQRGVGQITRLMIDTFEQPVN